MALFKDVADALVASREWDQATLSRLAYWVEVFGERDLLTITPDEVDAGLLRLAERGRLKGGKRATAATGKPLSAMRCQRVTIPERLICRDPRGHRVMPKGSDACTSSRQGARVCADCYRALALRLARRGCALRGSEVAEHAARFIVFEGRDTRRL
jgi:hypothetical protein